MNPVLYRNGQALCTSDWQGGGNSSSVGTKLPAPFLESIRRRGATTGLSHHATGMTTLCRADFKEFSGPYGAAGLHCRHEAVKPKLDGEVDLVDQLWRILDNHAGWTNCAEQSYEAERQAAEQQSQGSQFSVVAGQPLPPNTPLVS